MTRSVLSSKRGVALLMALGILVIMSILGVSFATSMRLGEKGSKAFLWNMQVKYMAEGGTKRTIADLKYNTSEGAATKFLDDRNEDWYFSDGPGTDIETANNSSFKYVFNNKLATIEYISGFLHEYADVNPSKKIIGTVKLKVIDTGSQININDNNNPDLNTILENLVGILGAPLVAGDGNDIYNNRPYGTKKEIQKISGIGPGKYNKIKDYITITSYEDPNNNSKSAININTASSPVLEAIFQNIVGAKANALASAVITSGPFNSWADFNNFIEGLPAGLTAAEADDVMASVNPNQTGVDDTKFIFNSGGTYDIECLATIRADRGGTGVPAGETDDVVLAEKKIETTAQVFSMWNQTTKEQFQGDVDIDGDGTYDVADGDIDFNSDGDVSDIPVYACVTWKNSCPVNYDNCLKTHIYDPNNAETIASALKMGFWDDFEDYDTSGTNKGPWKALEQTFEINKGGDGRLRTWPTAGFIEGVDYFPKVELDGNKWRFDDFSIRARMIDETSEIKSPLRKNLPWPAVPQSPWWEGAAPGTCPGEGGECNSHERWMNVSHLQFGTGAMNPAAIYCSYPQTVDIVPNLVTPEYDAIYGVGNYQVDGADNQLYNKCVSYDLKFVPAGSPQWVKRTPVWFAPNPEIKPYAVLSLPHVMVFCNEWVWAGHRPYDGTIHFLMPAYYSDKTFQFRSKGQRDLKGTVYYSGGSTAIDTGIEPLMEWTNRLIRMVGMGNLFDTDNVRIIGEDGSYESLPVDQTLPALTLPTNYEWGAIFTTVTIPSTANGNNEKVILKTSNAGEGVWSYIGGGVSDSTSADTGAGPGGCSVTGSINETDSTSIQYKIEFTTSDDDLSETPVLEDVWITYFPPAKALYWREVKE